jgi:hypothetical protein
MTDTSVLAQCIVCSRSSQEVPLIVLEYRESAIRICPQHLPVLIHDPAQLTQILPGAETFKPPKE